jgi:hypothetical protein
MRWVRAIISMAMAGTVIYGFIIGKINWEAFSVIATGSIGWWYYDRSKEKKAIELAQNKKLNELEQKLIELTKSRTEGDQAHDTSRIDTTPTSSSDRRVNS